MAWCEFRQRELLHIGVNLACKADGPTPHPGSNHKLVLVHAFVKALREPLSIDT
jgi:hypothetical protein